LQIVDLGRTPERFCLGPGSLDVHPDVKQHQEKTMRLRSLALGSAAALAIAAFASTSMAEEVPSSPAERAQTGTLNTQESDSGGTTEDGQPGNVADAQYKDQMLRYRAEQEQYKGQKDQYQSRLERYEYDRSHPSEWWSANYDHATLTSFYSIPHHDLIGKEVDGRDGMRLGRIRDVEREQDGQVERVDVALAFNRAAWIDARHLRYDAADQVMFTDVSADELYDGSRDYNPRP
jgi:hypothetical protein